MKKFLIHLAKIIFPILFFFLVLEIALRNIPNDFKVKKEYLEQNASEINTLILGSSHTFYGINPEYFSKKTFNAAYVSQDLDLDYEILNSYQSKLKNLETVIIPISYFSLFETLETDIEKWRVKNYVLYYGFENKYRFIDNFETLNQDVTLNSKKAIKHYILNKSYITSSNLGWGDNYNSKVKNKFDGKYTATKHTVKNFDLYKVNINSLHKIIALSQKKKFKIVFITTPTHESYYNNLNKIQLNKTTSTINQLVHKNKNCSFMNLIDFNKFNSADFYDADHLNEIGAKKLSVFLNNSLTR